jgi:hypothetical protein
MAVINRLKSVLPEKQLTGKWLAEHIGKSENTISKWCSNKGQPSLENLIEIAHTLWYQRQRIISFHQMKRL